MKTERIIFEAIKEYLKVRPEAYGNNFTMWIPQSLLDDWQKELEEENKKQEDNPMSYKFNLIRRIPMPGDLFFGVKVQISPLEDSSIAFGYSIK